MSKRKKLVSGDFFNDVKRFIGFAWEKSKQRKKKKGKGFFSKVVEHMKR